MTTTEYYTNQLTNVKPHATEYAPTFKVFANGNGNDTKHISLNEESAAVLISWLTDNFIKVYGVRCRETGSEIERNLTEQGAKRLIEVYENSDKVNGNYTPEFYEVFKTI